MGTEEEEAMGAFDDAFDNAEETTLSAYHASGCSTIADFLSSPRCRAQTIVLANSLSAIAPEVRSFLQAIPQIKWGENALFFKLRTFRIVSHQPGFWNMLCTGIPTCTTFIAANANTLSASEIEAFCAGVGSDKCTFRTLMLHGQEYGGAEMNEDNYEAIRQYLWPALLQNASVNSLSIITRFGTGHNLLSMLTHRNCRLTSLTLYITPEIVRFVELHLKEVFNGFAQNTIFLTSLYIHSLCIHRISPPEEFGKMLASNKSLTSLRLHNCHVPTNVFRELFSSVATNCHLQVLSLAQCDGAWPYAVVLDSLQTNTVFHELDLQGTPLKYNAAIFAQLARNQRNAEQAMLLLPELPSISAAGNGMDAVVNQDVADEVNMVKPTGIRLFLCGLPYSGKTTLSRSFCELQMGGALALFRHRRFHRVHRRWLPWARGRVPERTRGIEVTTVEEDDLRLSLWDLAGQDEYYTFHDYMFPNFSSRATPAFFLFVWNPIEVDEQGHHKRDLNGAPVEKPIEKFEKEFKYWLRFITSKTLRSEKFKPRLIIVITRKDCHSRHMKGWIHGTLQNLHNTFGDIIQFDMNGLFEIDAREPRELNELAKCLFACARDILNSAPKVHVACKYARAMIATLTDSQSIAPLITRAKFQSLCEKHLSIDSEKAQEAIALSLNDSGDIIYFASLQFVVVDTQWFCHQVMGDLMFNSIQSQSSGHKNPQGIFSVKYLEELLEAQVNTAANSKSSRIRQAVKAYRRNLVTHAKVGGEDLVKLLVELQLACCLSEDEGNLNVFIPASLSRKNYTNAPQFPLRQEGIQAYIGRRLKCKDSKRTFLTPGILPLLQVVFYSTIETTNQRQSAVQLEEDLILYAQEGNGVIIELFKQQGEEHFIDVLVCSHLEPAYAIKWVYKNVITPIERECAKPKGIQGVELEQEVVRPDCVKFIDQIERRTQSVSVKDLKERLEKHLREEGFGADGFNNVLHTWIPAGNSHRVDQLLGEEMTLQIVEAYWRGLSVAASDALGVVQKDTGIGNTEKKLGRSNLQEQQVGKHYYGKLEAIDNKLDEVLSEMKKLRKELQIHGKKIDDLRDAVIPKLKALFTFLKEGEAKLPRMLVVSKGHGGLVSKVATAMVPKLSSWRLELLCECESGPHSVEEHPGINVATLDDGLLKRGLPYINTFLKVANLALKVGAHVTAGLGAAVPDFKHVLALIGDTNDFPGLPTISDPADPLHTTTFASRENFQEGQQWLRQVLANRKYLSDVQIQKIFGLTRIRYPNHKVAWVCKEHSHQGQLSPAWP